MLKVKNISYYLEETFGDIYYFCIYFDIIFKLESVSHEGK